ncbi:probable methyltransferase PMT15 [Zea mays]|nr:probable methyltransferase PMT15 [Zea mays]XP_008658147.1 probable methyltransferase PMT15 [Zea mays]|eukprot:XP_008658146.1 probable methyltransferase PMT15 [Zea mays]
MSTYPRTYDLIHADSMFTLYKNRCEMDRILLEMDRILRPRGTVIIREDVDLLVKVKSLANGISRRTVKSINDMKEHCFWSQIMERKGPTVETAEWGQE